MSQIRWALVLAGAMFCILALANAEGETETGADLLRDCTKGYSSMNSDYPDFENHGYCLGFIRVVWQMSDKSCGPPGVPMMDVAQIFMKYAKDNPEWLHRPAEEVVSAAHSKAFPCRPR
jgi:hypothetical protein